MLKHRDIARRFQAARLGALVLLLALALLLGACPLAQAAVKNVIMLIPDGCSSEQYTLARWAKGAPLAQDAILAGMVRTFIADSVVADSAPAGTAYATGVRTDDKLVGLAPHSQGLLPGLPDPGAEAMRPLATVLEAAKLLGKSTGLVVTARVTDATPADFVAHVSHRHEELAIAKQMAHAGLDVLMGGGRKYFLPQAKGGLRTDGQDLLEMLRRQGCQTPGDKEALAAITGGRVLGLFAPGDLAADLDRPLTAPGQPTLAQMTAKALEVLSQNPQGFFLMVEGSQVDWACHTNDPAYLVGELLAYDQAVQTALDFAKKDGQTLLIAVSDHNTGGMSIGNQGTDKTYTTMKPSQLLGPIRAMRVTAKTLMTKLGGPADEARLIQGVRQWWGAELSPQEARQALAIATQFPRFPENGLAQVFSAGHTMVGWTTHGHCGGDVPLFAYGPGHPSGLMEGPQVALAVAQDLGVDLRALDQRLYTEAGPALAGAQLGEKETPRGWVLSVTRVGHQASLEADTNLLSLDGREVALEGRAIRVGPTGKWYLPRQALDLILGAQAPAGAEPRAAAPASAALALRR